MMYLKAFWHANPVACIITLIIFLLDYAIFSYALFKYTKLFEEEFSSVDSILAWIPGINFYVFGKLVGTLKLLSYIDHADYIMLAAKLLFVFGFFFKKPIIMMIGFIVGFITTFGAYRQYFEITENENAILPVVCVVLPIIGPVVLLNGTK